MCFKSKVPSAPAVQAAPQRQDVDTGAARRKLEGQKGVYGNIFTSALGDVEGYGKNVKRLATLGGHGADRATV